MITIVFISALALVALYILSVVPGVNTIFRPILESIGKVVVAVFEFSWDYIIWAIKTFFMAHTVLLRHLTHRKSYFDIEEKLKE